MASADGSVSWAQAFLHGTSRGRELLDELAELERRLASAGVDCTHEDYRRVAGCWLRIVEEASAYAALSTACHYTAVLKRFQTGMRTVLDELGRGLDALAPLTHTDPSQTPLPAVRRGRHHLRLIACGSRESTPARAPGDGSSDALQCSDVSRAECSGNRRPEQERDS
jgi:hypothetical protein